MMKIQPLVSGDLVHKQGGYPFPGVVVGTFMKADNTVMLNVESVFHPGMVHIFPAKAMTHFKGSVHELIELHSNAIKEHHNG